MASRNNIKVIEIVVNDNQIIELVSKLNELKENRNHLHINILNNTQLLIHHLEDELLK